MDKKGLGRSIFSRRIGGERMMRMEVRGLGVFTFVFFLLFAGTSLVQATSYPFAPIPSNLYNLDHWDYYAWGVDASDLAANLAAGEVIDSAQFTIYDINDWTRERDDVLHMWLVDELPDVPWWDENWPGLSRGTDSQGTDDIFEGCGGTFLQDWTDTTRRPEDLTVDILDLDALTSYILNDGMFGLALDPDCHYYNRGLRLTINTTPPPPSQMPEPVTMLGVFTGLGALAGYLRRRRRTVA